MDKAFEWIFRNFGKVWLVSAAMGLVVLGVGIWAVVSLVLHFTSN